MSTALVSCPVHAILSNISLTRRQWMIDNERTVVRFLPVGQGKQWVGEKGSREFDGISVCRFSYSKIVPPVRCVHDTGDLKRKNRMIFFYKTIKVVWPLLDCMVKGFVLKVRDVVKWTHVPLQVSCCWDIREGRDKSTVRHGVVVKIPCVQCTVTVEDIVSVRMSSKKSLRDTSMVRGICIATPEYDTAVPKRKLYSWEGQSRDGQGLLNPNLLLQWSSFLQNSTNSSRVDGASIYPLLAIEPLHNLHLGISELVK